MKHIIKKNFIIVIISVFLISFTANTSTAHDGAGVAAYFLFPPLYDNECSVALLPATIGSMVSLVPAYIIGGTAYVAGYMIGYPFGKEKKISRTAGFYTGLGVVRFGGYVAGAPFYILEKTFYDFPKALFFEDEFDQPENKQINIIVEPDQNTNKDRETHNELRESQQPKKKVQNTATQKGIKESKPKNIIQIKPVDLNKLHCPTRIVDGVEEVKLLSGMSDIAYQLCQEKIRRMTNRTTSGHR